MSLGVRYLDPEEDRVFTFNWSKHLNSSDVITSALVETDDDVTIGSTTFDGQVVRFKASASGITPGSRSTVKCTVETDLYEETLVRRGVIEVQEL